MKRLQLLAALDSVRAWAKDLPEDVEPFRLQPIPGLVVQVRDGRGANAEKCARYRQRLVTRVSTGVATPPDTKRDTSPTRVVTVVESVSRPVSDTVSNPPSLGFPLASPSGSLPPSIPKESAASSEGSDRSDAREGNAAAAAAAQKITTGSAGSADAAHRETAEAAPSGSAFWTSAQPAESGRDWSKRPPLNCSESLDMPLAERSSLALRDTMRATYIEPDKWPEVRLAVVAYREATKAPRLRVGTLATDPGVRRLLELYAAGCTADEVCAAIPLVVASPWWAEKPRDLGSLSLTVLRRALAERKPAPATDLAALPRQMFGEST